MKTSQILKTLIISIMFLHVQLIEAQGEKSGNNDSKLDYDWSGDGFSITIGAGLPYGDTADFTSFVYSADIGYTFSASKDVYFSAEAGYLRYTGKEISVQGGSSFKTDGDSFVPIRTGAGYNFNDNLGAEVYAGYYIGTGEFSENYFAPSVDFGYRFASGIRISAEISFSGSDDPNYFRVKAQRTF